MGLSEISAELSSAISIRDASCLAFSLDKELDEASEEFLADTVAEQALILLPEAAWTSLGKSKVDAESTLESSHSFQIWRTRIRENSPSELILIKLEMGSHCGSGGCENVLLGFLAVDSVYQLVLVQVGDLNEGVVLVRQYKEDEMPEIFTATMRQTGRSDQTRRVRTYQFVSRSNCYEAFLNGRVKSIELPFDNEEKRIPHKILRD